MSELYELPDGWEWKKLKDICKFENGDRGKNYPSKSTFVDSGIAVISAKDLNGWSIDLDKLNYINEERYNLIGGGKIKKDDILFCLRGSLGKCGLVNNLQKGVIASSLVIVRTNNELLTTLLLYYFNSGIATDFINEYNNGAAQPNLSAKNLSLFEFPLPPLQEQKRIVSKLNNLFEKIDKSIALHQKNMDEADVFMGSVLNDVFGELEEKYLIKKLNDVCIKITDGTHKSPKTKESGYPYITVRDVTDKGQIDFNNCEFVNDEDFKKLKDGNCAPSKNDVLFSKDGTVGKVTVVDFDKEFVVLSSLAILRPSNELSPYFLFYTMKSPKFFDFAQSKKTGAAIKRVVLLLHQ